MLLNALARSHDDEYEDKGNAKENIFENAKDALYQLSASKELQSTITLQHACLKQYDKNR
jgi:hypothetical protein